MLSLTPPANRVAPLPPEDDYPFAQTLLTVTFATSDDLAHVASEAPVSLAAVPELSCDDAYLLLPLRARDALLRAFAKGRVGALEAWFDVALVLRGEVERVRSPRLWVGDVWRASEVIRGEAAARVASSGPGGLVEAVNALPWIERLALGGLVDAEGAEAILGAREYVGVSRRGFAGLGLGRDAVASTFVWSAREDGAAHVRVALSSDDDDALSCLLSPVALALGA